MAAQILHKDWGPLCSPVGHLPRSQPPAQPQLLPSQVLTARGIYCCECRQSSLGVKLWSLGLLQNIW